MSGSSSARERERECDPSGSGGAGSTVGTASRVSAHVKGSLRTAGKQAINTERSNRTPAGSAGSDAQLQYGSTYKGRDAAPKGPRILKKWGGGSFAVCRLAQAFYFYPVAFL